jgi:hypothetical protein
MMIAIARLRCPLEYCTATTGGDMVKSTREATGTLAASSRAATNRVIWSIRLYIRDWTTSADGPLAWTIRSGSAKLVAHWPPLLGSRTDHPS